MTGLDVVIPLRDEEANVGPLIGELRTALAGLDWRVILVDDGSRDQTAALIRQEAEADPDHVLAVVLGGRCGKQVALLEGFARSERPLVLTMDGDLQDDPAAVPALLAAINDGADAVIAVRTRRAEGPVKTLPSRALAHMVRRRFGLELPDVNAPMRLVRRELLDGLTLRDGEFRFLPVLWRLAGRRVDQVPVIQRERRAGVSKFRGAWRFVEALFVLWTLPAAPRKRHWWLRVVGTLLLLALVAAVVDLGALANAFRAVPARWMVALGAANLAVLALKALRWRTVLAGWGIELRHGEALRAYLVGTLFGNLTPMHAGAVVRATVVVRHAHGRVATALASVLVDRGFDLLFLSLVALHVVVRPASPWLMLLGCGVAVAAFVLLASCMRVDPDAGVGLSVPSLRVRGSLWAPALLTVAAYAVFWGLAWQLARAAGIQIHPLELAGVLAAVNLVAIVPVTWSGIGARELAMVVFLSPLGVDPTVAVAFGVAYSVTFYLSSVSWGALALLADQFMGRRRGNGK